MTSVTTSPARPFDGVLLISFGGPEQPADVIPFLQNVTRGRGVPPERLEAVAEHYHHFGGRSPINDQNRALLAALRAEFDARGLAGLPLFWGNRTWRPFLTDALAEAAAAGARRLAVLVTSAYPSYSGCRQYREDLAEALAEPALEGAAMVFDKIRNYANHPGFVGPVTDAVVEGLTSLPAAAQAASRVVFVTHSVPTAMDAAAGPRGGGYTALHRDVARAVMAGVSRSLPGGPGTQGHDLVYCSRSGPGAQPWLEPDINDHLRALSAAGVAGVVVVPIGFVSDHMEVAYDLDTEAKATASDLGLAFVRTATAGTDPRFVAALAGLVLERAAVLRGEVQQRPALGALGASHDVCPAGCCRNPRGWRPAAAGEPEQDPSAAPAGRLGAVTAPAGQQREAVDARRQEAAPAGQQAARSARPGTGR
jgi:ferrochelatase